MLLGSLKKMVCRACIRQALVRQGRLSECAWQVLTGHHGAVACGSFTPDGKQVVTGGGEGDASLRVWSPKTGECTCVVQGHGFHKTGARMRRDASCSGLLVLLSDAGAALQGSPPWVYMATRMWSSRELRTALLTCPTSRLGVCWAS